MIETNITKMFGIKYPIVVAPMGPFRTTFLSEAVSEKGGLGVLSHTSYTPSGFVNDPVKAMKENMEYMVEHTDGIFGFNVRTSRNEINAPRICAEVPVLIKENTKIKEQCRYALTSAGSSRTLPKSQSYQELKASGSQIKHFHVAPALWLAEKCVNNPEGVVTDGIVVTGHEGGGHQSYEKISTLVLLQQITKKLPDVPKIACGGFATGEGLAAALSLGAGAIAMGSRFIASKESEFHETYKGVVPPAKAQDTIVVTGALGLIRLWQNDYSLSHGVVSSKEEKIAEENARRSMSREEMIAALEKEAKAYIAAYQGDIKSGAVLLGQSIGVIDSLESVSDIIDVIMKDAEASLKRATAQIK